jgi:hypothetical protein
MVVIGCLGYVSRITMVHRGENMHGEYGNPSKKAMVFVSSLSMNFHFVRRLTIHSYLVIIACHERASVVRAL